MTSPEDREILERLTKLEQYFKMRGDRLKEIEQDLLEIQNNQKELQETCIYIARKIDNLVGYSDLD